MRSHNELHSNESGSAGTLSMKCGALQELERDLTDAASEVEELLRDKDDLGLTVDALQTDLASERRLNEEMQSILESFRNQDM